MAVNNQLTGCEANPYTPTDIAPTSFLAAFGFKRDGASPRIYSSNFLRRSMNFSLQAPSTELQSCLARFSRLLSTIHAHRFAAVTIAMCASLSLPSHSAEMRMSVSAVVLSYCSMQLTNAAIADTNGIGATPFTARCNTPVAPRIRSTSQIAAMLDVSSTPAATYGARAQSEVIGAVDGGRRSVQYIQYTIEY